MKKIYRSFIKGTNWALAGLITLCGFSCSDSDDNNPPAPEYGVPYARYTIKGLIKDEHDKVIPGIKIKIKSGNDYVYDNNALSLSNKEGTFDITYSSFLNETFKIIAEDIDGELNGNFQTDSVDVTFTKDDFFEKGDRWYEGGASKEIPPIILKERFDE